MTAPPPRARLGALVFVLLAGATGLGLFALRRAPTVTPTPADASLRALPRDPAAWLPVSARAAVLVRVDRLRASPPIARWLTDATPPGECEAELARRLQTVAVVVPRFPLQDFAIVAVGDFTEGLLTRCASSRPERRAVVQRTRYRGVPVVRVTRGGDDVAPASQTEIVWLPNGVVLVGEHDLVRAILDRGIDHREARPETSRLGPLLASPGDAPSLVGARWFSRDEANADDGWRAVQTFTVTAHTASGLEIHARLRCDTADGAAHAAQEIRATQQRLLADLEPGSLRALVAQAVVETEGSEARVAARLDEAGFSSLLAGAASVARGLGSYLQPAPRDR